MRPCPKCGEPAPITKNRSGYCRRCQNQAAKKSYLKNRDRLLERQRQGRVAESPEGRARRLEVMRAWKAAHPEAVAAARLRRSPEALRDAASAYYEQHKGDPDFQQANRESARRYREANPDKARLAARKGRLQWERQNPEAARLQRQQQSKRRRALKRAAFVEHVDPLVVLELDDGVCGICGGDVDPFDFHVDHVVPLARGGLHAYANSQPAHPVCNSRKQDRLQEQR